MGSCDFCGTTILFGGVRDARWRFCNEQCRQQGTIFAVADRIPEDLIARSARQAHEGAGPKCQGPGPVDVHTSHTVWSALIMTSWRSKPEVCCHSCGTRSKVGAALSSAVLGWWGFPWGIIMTPVQVARNLRGLISPPDPTRPSDHLEKVVRLDLANHHVENQRRQQDQPPG